MRYTTLGVIGHVDHGKTSLVKALSGVDTDRLREEKERGISISLGYAHLTLPSGEMGIIDAPGHERFIRTMISGATGMAAVLLVVDVNEGVKPQTVEHLDIARLLGIQLGVIAITKCDTADEELADLVFDDVQDLVRGTFLADAPVVHTSATQGDGIDALRDALDSVLQRSTQAVDEGWAYLPVDRAFTMTGFGTVVTGTLHRGSIALEDELEIYPRGVRTRVRELQSHNASTARAEPGYRTAVNLRGLEKESIGRGDILAAPESLDVGGIVDVVVMVLASAAPLKQRQAVRLLFGTTETFARIHLLDRDTLGPGERCVMQLRLDAPVPILHRERFILRTYSPMTTIAGGQFLDVAQRGYRRHDGAALARLETLVSGGPQERIAAALGKADTRGCTLTQLRHHTRLSEQALAKGLRKLKAVEVGDRVFAREVAEAMREAVKEAVKGFHATNPTLNGVARDRLRGELGISVEEPTFGQFVAGLVGEKLLAESGGLLRLATFTPEGALSDAQRAVAAAIEGAFAEGGLTPPRIDEVIGGDAERQKLYQYLRREGRVIAAEVTTRNRTANPSIAFHRDTLDDAARRLHEEFGDRPFTASEAKEPLRLSRKYLIPLLEALDRIGMTRRSGDERVVTASDCGS